MRGGRTCSSGGINVAKPSLLSPAEIIACRRSRGFVFRLCQPHSTSHSGTTTALLGYYYHGTTTTVLLPRVLLPRHYYSGTTATVLLPQCTTATVLLLRYCYYGTTTTAVLLRYQTGYLVLGEPSVGAGNPTAFGMLFQRFVKRNKRVGRRGESGAWIQVTPSHTVYGAMREGSGWDEGRKRVG